MSLARYYLGSDLNFPFYVFFDSGCPEGLFVAGACTQVSLSVWTREVGEEVAL